jgi:hypothetical protein
MQAEIFTNVLLSYKRLLSKRGIVAPCLRDYCRSQHIVYRTFIRWASTQAIATGILEVDSIERGAKSGRYEERVKRDTSAPACPTGKEGQPLLYPLHLIKGRCDDQSGTSVVSPSEGTPSLVRSQAMQSVLRGVRITLPNGTKLSIREAESKGIYALVHGIE